MLKIKFLNSFKKDYKRIVKRGYDIALLENVIRMLADGETLPAKYRDHALDSNVRRFFSSAIQPFTGLASRRKQAARRSLIG